MSIETIERFKVACAWCGKLLRDGSGPTSHSVCPQCAKRMTEGDELLPNNHLADIMATGRRYDRAFYALAIVAGCVAAGATLVTAVWLLQWTGRWPGVGQ